MVNSVEGFLEVDKYTTIKFSSIHVIKAVEVE